jgi:nitronate monooxygenase
MASNRREFIRHAAAVAAGLGVHGTRLEAEAQPASMPTPRARAFMKLFGLTHPIGNAGMGGFATPELAIAVSEAGGLGAVGTGRYPVAAVVKDYVARARAGTRRPFAVNYLLAAEPVTLPIALDAGAPIIQFAWGLPTREMTASVRRAGAKLGVQVSSRLGARQALDLGADYLICQGTEAGGHVQAISALYETLPGVVEEAGTVPILAAGGIANGSHIRRALMARASGVLIGTRFVATTEAEGHDEWKQALVRAKTEDSVLTVCFQDGWENAPTGVLRNRTVEMWEAAGCPPPGRRPGEGDVLTTNATTGQVKRRYSIGAPRREDRGEVLDLPLYAGKGVGAIRDIPSAGELVARLWRECLDAR